MRWLGPTRHVALLATVCLILVSCSLSWEISETLDSPESMYYTMADLSLLSDPAFGSFRGEIGGDGKARADAKTGRGDIAISAAIPPTNPSVPHHLWSWLLPWRAYDADRGADCPHTGETQTASREEKGSNSMEFSSSTWDSSWLPSSGKLSDEWVHAVARAVGPLEVMMTTEKTPSGTGDAETEEAAVAAPRQKEDADAIEESAGEGKEVKKEEDEGEDELEKTPRQPVDLTEDAQLAAFLVTLRGNGGLEQLIGPDPPVSPDSLLPPPSSALTPASAVAQLLATAPPPGSLPPPSGVLPFVSPTEESKMLERQEERQRDCLPEDSQLRRGPLTITFLHKEQRGHRYDSPRPRDDVALLGSSPFQGLDARARYVVINSTVAGTVIVTLERDHKLGSSEAFLYDGTHGNGLRSFKHTGATRMQFSVEAGGSCAFYIKAEYKGKEDERTIFHFMVTMATDSDLSLLLSRKFWVRSRKLQWRPKQKKTAGTPLPSGAPIRGVGSVSGAAGRTLDLSGTFQTPK